MGQAVLLAFGVLGTVGVIAFIALVAAPEAAPASPAALVARAALEAPSFQPGGPGVTTPCGAVLALDAPLTQLAILLPLGAHHVLWVVPATAARIEAARRRVIIATGDFTRPTIRAAIPEDPAGDAFMNALARPA